MMECELAKCSNYVQPRSWSLERQWTAAIFHALCGVLGCSFFPRLEKQNQVPKFEPPDEIPIEMRIKVPISAFGKNKFRFLADKRGPDRDANLGPHFLLLPPPHQGVSHAPLVFFRTNSSDWPCGQQNRRRRRLSVITLEFFLFVICDCVGDAAGVGAPVMCVVRWGRGSSKGSLVIHKLCFVWGWMLVYRAEFEAVQLRVYDR
jgi:hypothetical protein